MTREAELELEIARLREALQTYIDEHEECQDADDWMAMMCSIEAHHVADEALSTPPSTTAPSTTALQDLIEKIERRTIERCAKAADELRHTDGFSAESADWCSGTIHAAYAIRALPTGNLKLEDLK